MKRGTEWKVRKEKKRRDTKKIRREGVGNGRQGKRKNRNMRRVSREGGNGKQGETRREGTRGK